MTARQLFISPIAGWLGRFWINRKIAYNVSTLAALADAKAEAGRVISSVEREERRLNRAQINLRSQRNSL